jgi:hypothetical protein
VIAPIIRDSAGIRIVNNSQGLWRGGEEWTIDEVPLADIGGGPARSHALTRADHAVRLRNGTIVILDRGDAGAELRAYRGYGGAAAIWTKSGQGPGELRSPRAILQDHDGGVAVSHREDVWIGFDTGGRYTGQLIAESKQSFSYSVSRDRQLPPGVSMADIWSGRVPAPPPDPAQVAINSARMTGLIVVIGPLSDGTWLGRQQMNSTLVLGIVDKRDQVGVRLDANRNVIDSLGEFFISAVSTRMPEPAGALRHHGHLLTAGRQIIQATSHDAEYRVYRLDGSLATIVRHPLAPTSLHHGTVTDSSSQSPRLPVYGNMLVDVDCNVWRQEYSAPGTGPSDRWTVFDSTGLMLGNVGTPGGIDRVLQVGSDYLLAHANDGDDVPHIKLFPLRKPNVVTPDRAHNCQPPWSH